MGQTHAHRFVGLLARLLLIALMIAASLGLVSTGTDAAASAQGIADETQAEEQGTAPAELRVSSDIMVTAADLTYREGPGLDAAVLAILPSGTQGAITDGPVAADGYTWYEFSTADYGVGWVAGEFLAAPVSPNGVFAVGDSVVAAGDDLHLRAEPGLGGIILAGLSAGTAMTISDGPVSADGFDWYEVSVADQGVTGWVAGDFLWPGDGTANAFELGDESIVAADGLNMRDAPTLDGGLIAQLAAGTPVLITSGAVEVDGYSWYRITVDDGTDATGWVAGEFLALP